MYRFAAAMTVRVWRVMDIVGARARRGAHRLSERSGDDSGQGTTEYAILVGVLVVIAILAVVLFRDKLQELWDSIAEGINSL